MSERPRRKSHSVFAPCLRIDSSANQDRKSLIIHPEGGKEGGSKSKGDACDWNFSPLFAVIIVDPADRLTFDKRRCKRSIGKHIPRVKGHLHKKMSLLDRPITGFMSNQEGS